MSENPNDEPRRSTSHDLSDSSLESLFDQGPWSGFQISVLCLTALAVILDGLDNQALGFSLPAIMSEWNLGKQAFAPVLAVGQLGVMIGVVLGGIAGDRLGRKTCLIGSVVIFGASTLAIAGVHTVLPLAFLRLVAGFGIGGTFPNAAALVAEFTPLRRRSLAVTISIVCVPLGGVFGGFIAAVMLPVQGWRALFLLAGTLSLIVALLLLFALPESLRFLVRKGVARVRILRTLEKMKRGIPEQATHAHVALAAEEPVPPRGGILSRAFLRDTLLLWVAFLFTLAAIYIAFGWLPTMLTERGFDISTASSGLAAFNLGGVVIAVVGGWLVGRYGSRSVIFLMAIAASASGALLAAFPPQPSDGHLLLYAAFAIEGGFVNGVQTNLYALAAFIYPTAIRATGVGAASGAGRIGAISSSAIGAGVLALGGASGFHVLVAVSLAVVALALLFIKRQDPGGGAPALVPSLQHGWRNK
jgi:AAHS family 4-hydroxybenzoate transporter-like MFS transporter